MKANRAFRLLVAREGRGPAIFAPRDRLDRVEVVEIDSGESVLFWDLPPREARRLANALREDMALMEAADFLDAWRSAQE
ncbi:hypothetical protein [Conexibacter arvalis]|uniref:Uncharacterized protein n=1 Tax=Conexibacter arvalis TaxID=912552 RepID=A0A840IJR9_9ACTN|nr:hypothetical protein [Conexibacter arvalis]MBB4665016.1 hypothetical protein [Conexibacter arvalis]